MRDTASFGFAGVLANRFAQSAIGTGRDAFKIGFIKLGSICYIYIYLLTIVINI